MNNLNNIPGEIIKTSQLPDDMPTHLLGVILGNSPKTVKYSTMLFASQIASQMTDVVRTSFVYNDPTWLGTLSWNKIIGAPAFLTSINSANVITALGYTPANQATTITINGVTYDLSANRSWTISTSGSANLDQVTTNGNTTTNSITVGAFTTTGKVILNNATGNNRPLEVSSNETVVADFRNTGAPSAYLDIIGSGGSSTQMRLGIFGSVIGFTRGSDNTPKLVLDASNNVGIGTISPTHRLHVSASVNVIKLESSAANHSIITSVAAGGNTIDINNITGSLEVITGTITRLTVKSGGNVLIGTTTDSIYKLDVNGSIRSTLLSRFAGIVVERADTNENVIQITQASGASAAHLYSYGAGYLGWIGTGPTGRRFAFESNPNNESGRHFNLVIYDSAGTNGLTSFTATRTLFTVGQTFRTNIDTYLAVSSGNVLIGTTTDAGYKFDVSGTARIQGNLNIKSGGTKSVNIFYPSPSNSILTFEPDVQNQGLSFGSASTSRNWVNGIKYFGGDHTFYSDITTHRMFIEASTGNVGIGTLIPTAKLHVSGDIKATLANVSTANVVYYDSTTGLLTYGTAPSGGGISLTSLSATSPLLYNNTTGVFSIQVATTSQNGYLSSTDWTTFNGKQNALGYTPVPETRTLTINGTGYDLSANRSWTIASTKEKRHDFVSAASTDYCGTAVAGSSESASVWTIKKIVIGSSGSTTITTATNVAWVDRLTATYT